MKIDTVRIDGFRGSPKLWEIKFKAHSAVIQGQNGRGKSTIADAIEFWSSAEIEDFRREGYGLDAAINIEHGGPARVAIKLDSGAEFERILEGSRASELINKSGENEVPPPVPILRHKSIARFMFKSPGDKRAELLPILGLDELLPFKAELVTATNAATKAAKSTKVAEQASERELSEASDGLEPIARADELRKTAGLPAPIESDSDLLSLDLAESSSIRSAVEWVRLVESIESARAKVVGSAVTEWNQLVADQAAVTADRIRTLLEAGTNVIDDWPDESCPLCLSDFDRSALKADIEKRAIELEDLSARFANAETLVAEHITNVNSTVAALDALLATTPKGDWPQREQFEEARAAIAEHAQQSTDAVAKRTAIPVVPVIDLKPLLDAARITAVEESKDAAGPALAKLERLRIAFSRHDENVAANAQAETVRDGLKRVLEITESEVRTAVESEVQAISQLTAEFFGKLVSSQVYSDVQLKYDDRRQGGMEFELTYKSNIQIKPPQRVVSESQLNALGIALFLARCKTTEDFWKTLVLDDVVNSFDSDNRISVATILRESFSEWQVIFLTHDKVFAKYAEDLLPGWYRWRISHWTPESGPVLGEDDPRAILRAELDNGTDTATLGGIARIALEMPLERIVNRLSIPIRYDRKHQYSANDYVEAIDQHLERSTSPIRDVADFEKLRVASYVTVLAAHYKHDDPVPSESDLRNMLEDLNAFERAFICGECSKPVWFRVEGFASSRSFSCECEKLKL